MVARQGAGVTRVLVIPSQEPGAKSPFEDLAKRAGDKLVKGAQS
ncbi:hypothetical protein QCN29_21345 [Streptomyces sp. HNM0663]|uniref:Uncharacterized protein n=1 Tax=Streptomyces chengmaiensis TaxID=3040919 RepID=A0ABT6HRD1_9ACTN|nr:hypothetical protein [Streptomyces chengmaiensis]MDH2391282.1 hypothetical protein [Streptomyces chengmaiensis]